MDPNEFSASNRDKLTERTDSTLEQQMKAYKYPDEVHVNDKLVASEYQSQSSKFNITPSYKMDEIVNYQTNGNELNKGKSH